MGIREKVRGWWQRKPKVTKLAEGHYEIPESACPVCGAVLGMSIKEDKINPTRRAPQAKDLSICFECGVLLEFTEDLKLRVMREEVWGTLPEDYKHVLIAAQERTLRARMLQRQPQQ